MAQTGKPYFELDRRPEDRPGGGGAAEPARQVVGPRRGDRDRGRRLGRDLGDDASPAHRPSAPRTALPRGGRRAARRPRSPGPRCSPRSPASPTRTRSPGSPTGAALEERLERAIARYDAGEADRRLLLCDVDRLKAINDIQRSRRRRRRAAQGGAGADRLGGRLPGRVRRPDRRRRVLRPARDAGRGRRTRGTSRSDRRARRDHPAAADRRREPRRRLGLLRSRLRRLADRDRPRSSCTRPTPLNTSPSDGAAIASARRRRWPRSTARCSPHCPAAAPASASGRRPRRSPGPSTTSSRDAATLDRLEVVASRSRPPATSPAGPSPIASDGQDQVRDVSLGDNRELRHTGARVPQSESHYEHYELDDYPADPRRRRRRQRLVHHPRRRPRRRPLRAGAAGPGGLRGRDRGDGRRRLTASTSSSSSPTSPTRRSSRSMHRCGLAVRAAISPHRHRRDAEPLSRRHSRALELSLSLADRLAEATSSEQRGLRVAVEELQRAFGCSIVHIVGTAGEHFEIRAERGPIGRGAPDWAQKTSAGPDRPLPRRRPAGAQRRRDSRAAVPLDPQQRPDVRSELAVPIKIAAAPWGVVNLEDTALDAFDARRRPPARVGRRPDRRRDQRDRPLRAPRPRLPRHRRGALGTRPRSQGQLDRQPLAVDHRRRGRRRPAARHGRRGPADAPLRRRLPRHRQARDPPRDPQQVRPARSRRVGEDEAAHRHTASASSRPIEFLDPIRPIVRHAHERWDGGGYPDGLAGEDIPLGSRILFACDAFDAMTTDRTYNPAIPAEQAKQELPHCAGSQFDPRGGRGAARRCSGRSVISGTLYRGFSL